MTEHIICPLCYGCGRIAPPDKPSVGERIVWFREAKRMTTTQLSELVDVSRVAVWNHETGRATPRLKTLKRYAEVLGVRMEDLVP